MLERFAIRGGAIIEATDEASIFIYSAPDEAERQVLLSEYRLDAHDMGSSLDPDELGRLETDGGLVHCIVKIPRNFTAEDKLLFTVTSMGMFLYRNRLIVVTTDAVELFGDRQIHKVANLRDAVLKILYGLVNHFHDHLKVINMLSDSLEKRLHASSGNRYLLDMFTLEKSLVYFINGIASNQMVFEKMRLSAARMRLTAAQRDILEDIMIENQQCGRQADIYSDILTGLMDARGSIVSNNLSMTMKRLTMISVIFMPLTVLTGIGGMSEFTMMLGDVPWHVGYALFMVGLVVIGFATNFILQKIKLQRDEADIHRHRERMPRIPGMRERKRKR